MNANKQLYDQYKKTSVETTSQGNLVIMLYNGCITNIQKAKQAIRNRETQNAHENIIKAQKIIIELIVTLNMEYDIAQRLFVVYEYIYNQLVDANIRKDITLLDEAESYLADMRDTWQDAILQLKQSSLTNPQKNVSFTVRG